MVCQNEILRDVLKRRITASEPGGCFREAEILCKGEFDAQPLIDTCKWLIKNGADYDKKRALERLLEIQPSEESFQLAIEFFENPTNATKRYYCQDLISTLLSTDGFKLCAGANTRSV